MESWAHKDTLDRISVFWQWCDVSSTLENAGNAAQFQLYLLTFDGILEERAAKGSSKGQRAQS